MFALKHTNAYGETYWFCNLGNMWPHDPTKRLIERTSRRREQGREFASLHECREVLATAGRPSGWQVVDSEGRSVE